MASTHRTRIPTNQLQKLKISSDRANCSLGTKIVPGFCGSHLSAVLDLQWWLSFLSGPECYAGRVLRTTSSFSWMVYPDRLAVSALRAGERDGLCVLGLISDVCHRGGRKRGRAACQGA